MSSAELNILPLTRHRGLVLLLAAIAVLGVAAWLVLWVLGDRARVWQSLLISFVYFTPLCAGLVTWSAIVNLAEGRWAGSAEKVPLWGLGGGVVSLVLFILLVVLFVPSWSQHFDNPSWGIWQHERQDIPDKAFWMSTPFVFARDGIALLAFWVLAAAYFRRRMNGHRSKRLGTGLILAYAISMSLIGYDLVMGLDPVWYSSLLGPYFFISGLYIAMASWCGIGAASGFVHLPDRRQDLGKLLVAFSLLTTYMMYAQLLCIWYGNLPHEIRFVLPRLQGPPLMYVSVVLLATAYLGPLVLMLPQWVKRRRPPLVAMAVLVLVTMFLERWWLVVPTFYQGHGVTNIPIDVHPADILLALGCAAAVALGIGLTSRTRPGQLVTEVAAHD